MVMISEILGRGEFLARLSTYDTRFRHLGQVLQVKGRVLRNM